MKRDRIRCEQCKAALRNAPDIERVELWAYHEVWGDMGGYRDTWSQPGPATYLQATTGQAWKEQIGPYWTCQRCKHENDAEHVGEEYCRLYGLDEYDDDPSGY